MMAFLAPHITCMHKYMRMTCVRHELRKCAYCKICVFFGVCMGDVNSMTARCEWSVCLACNTYIRFLKGMRMACFTMSDTYRLMHVEFHLRLSRTTATYTRLSINSCTTGREHHLIGSSCKFHTLPFGGDRLQTHVSVKQQPRTHNRGSAMLSGCGRNFATCLWSSMKR